MSLSVQTLLLLGQFSKCCIDASSSKAFRLQKATAPSPQRMQQGLRASNDTNTKSISMWSKQYSVHHRQGLPSIYIGHQLCQQRNRMPPTLLPWSRDPGSRLGPGMDWSSLERSRQKCQNPKRNVNSEQKRIEKVVSQQLLPSQKVWHFTIVHHISPYFTSLLRNDVFPAIHLRWHGLEVPSSWHGFMAWLSC